MKLRNREKQRMKIHKNRYKRELAFRDSRKIDSLEWLPGSCRPGLCGEDAACIPGKNNNHKCVCPSDLSPPTEDKLCPTRKIGSCNTGKCNYCDCDDETADHVLRECPRWTKQRALLCRKLGLSGRELNLRSLLSTMLDDEEKWNVADVFARGVLRTKLLTHSVPFTPSPIRNINIIGGKLAGQKNITIVTGQSENEIEPRSVTASDGGLILGVLGLMCFVVFAGVVCWWRRKSISKCAIKNNHRKHEAIPSPLSLSKSLLGSYVPNPEYTASDTIPVAVLPRESLFFEQEIGEGCFGKVFKGELKREDGTKEAVAIKMLKDTASKQAEEDFMREVEIMSAFRHANILSLIGVVIKDTGARPWMVFEFMPFGDLAEVLRRNSRQLWKPVPGLKPLTKECLIRIAIQIAGGMKYLAGQRFVHNDLACRNCLVGSELTVKIADFGMSRDVYTCDYYRIGGSKPVPLRWMSPESVTYRKFTLESDVWSYGVVLWEIYSLGKQPYYGLSNEEVIKMILQGVMLIPPEDCPNLISELMRACWKQEPKDRIKFPDIYARLTKAWKEREFEKPNEPDTQNQNLNDSGSPALPRPPVNPVSHLETEDTELLDSENYLAPQTVVVNEYLQPLPD